MWVLMALGAALIWGVDYSISERIYKSGIAPLSIMAIRTLVACCVATLIGLSGQLRSDIDKIASDTRLTSQLCVVALTPIIGTLMMAFAIRAKNATVASMMEISYPLFVALMSFLIFGENQLTSGTVIGGTLIAAGAYVIYNFH